MRSVLTMQAALASMGSGRGDRNQSAAELAEMSLADLRLQWGPVVVTGISGVRAVVDCGACLLQWGPVVVTGIRGTSELSRLNPASTLQWGPVVVTGIRMMVVIVIPRW